MNFRNALLASGIAVILAGCSARAPEENLAAPERKPDYVLTKDQTHDKFSRLIEPVVRVPSGSVIEAHTHEATGGQLHPGSTADSIHSVDMDRVHTLTGPVHVEGAEPGDVLAVRLGSLPKVP